MSRRKTRLRWKMEGFDQLRNDPELVDLIDEKCAGVAERAGRGFEWKAENRKGKKGWRYRGIVFTDTPRAMVVNARDNTLLKALRGGG